MIKKVLIIEDNLEIQEIYELNFEAENFLVKLASDGMKWIVEILTFKPNIIILDIMMPDMDWFEVLKAIKNQSSIKTPILVCSNLNSVEDEKKAISYWADLYLRKSDYEWDEIVEKAKTLMKTYE